MLLRLVTFHPSTAKTPKSRLWVSRNRLGDGSWGGDVQNAWLVVPTRWSWFFYHGNKRIIRTSFEVYPSEFFRRHKFLGVQKQHLQKTPTADSMDGPQCHVKVKNLMVFPNWGGVRVCRWWKRTLQGTDRYPLLGKGKSSTQKCLFWGWIC